MKIKVTKCNNCPFKVSNYDDFALGDDTLLECNLKSYLGISDTFIGSYNLADDSEKLIPIPEDCPIKDIDIKINTDG